MLRPLADGQLDLRAARQNLPWPRLLREDDALLLTARELLRDLPDAAVGTPDLHFGFGELQADDLRHLAFRLLREGGRDVVLGAHRKRARPGARAVARPAGELRARGRGGRERHSRSVGELERTDRPAVDPGRRARNGPGTRPALVDR